MVINWSRDTKQSFGDRISETGKTQHTAARRRRAAQRSKIRFSVPHAAGVWHRLCNINCRVGLLNTEVGKKKKRRTEQRLGHRFSLQIHHFHHLLYSPITSIHLPSIKPRESIIFLKLQVQVSSLSSPPFSNSSQGKLEIHVQLLIS